MTGILPEVVRTRTTKGRIARVIFAGLQQYAEPFCELARELPDSLVPFIDGQQLELALQRVAWLEIPQAPLFNTLALLAWAHRHAM